MGISELWSSTDELGLSNNGLLDDSWGLTVNDGVESVDWVSGVGDGTDGTIGLNKGVLSLDDITVTGLVGRLGVSGKSIRDGVSVVVLWMRVIWLGGDGNSLGNWLGISDWGSAEEWLSNGNWGVTEELGLSISEWLSNSDGSDRGAVTDGSSVGSGGQSEDGEELLKQIIYTN